MDTNTNKNIIEDKTTILIPINNEWLKKNSMSWKKNDISRDIMSSDKYIKNVSERIAGRTNPENIYSEYNTINHSKIDFINFSEAYFPS